ncbi:MAG: hypothetical protein K2I64_00735 [Muribaculaceae bacterium]|nr:hypothetical protein [Muribaculaceae bacterium]
MKKFTFSAIAFLLLGASTMTLRAFDNTEACYDAINSALQSGDFATVDSLLDDWKKSNVAPAEALFAEGYASYRKGDIERAELLMDSAERMNPMQLDFRTRHIREQYLAGRKAKAFAGLRRLAAETAADPDGWTVDEDMPEMDAQEALVTLMSSYIYYHLNGKLPFDDIRQFADSVAAAVPDPGDVETKIVLGSILLENSDYEGAASILEKCLPIARQPRLSAVRTMLALLYGENGDAERASEMAGAVFDDPESDPRYVEMLQSSFSPQRDTLSYRQFQFTVLSYFASSLTPEWIPENLDRPDILIPEYLNGMSFAVDRDISGITAEKFDVEAHFGDSTAILPVIVWTMPEPKEFVDCKYVAFVPQGDSLRYITLEKTIPIKDDPEKVYIVCEAVFNADSQGYDHRNYGYKVGDALTTEQFSRLAAYAVYDMSSRAGVDSKGNKITIYIPADEEK